MKRNYGRIYAAPQALWLTVFFAAPLAIIVAYSFMKRDLYGGVQWWQFSLDAYKALANPTLVAVTLRTLWVSLAATVLTILIALPCGYSIARSGNQAMRLFLVIVPFWTNFLIRIYAWIAILGNEGFLNDVLRLIGLRDSVQFLYNQGAVILVLVYMYLPYAILPLFSTIDKFDFTLLEAARDLGATRMEAIRKVLMPNIRGGLVTAVLFTFIPIFGAYAVPLLVGGKDSYMLGNVIADQVMKTRNWPLASSISMGVTVLTGIAAVLFALVSRRSNHAVVEESGIGPVSATAGIPSGGQA
jgi:spermidine/putrescine transport system permease protein